MCVCVCGKWGGPALHESSIKFKVSTVSYGPRLFLFTYGPSTKRMGHKSKGKKGGSLTNSTDQENIVNKIIANEPAERRREAGEAASL